MINETLYHPEVALWRASTGGAYNFPGAYGVIYTGSAFPTKGAIPQPTGKNGTIISQGTKVRGTGTLFLSQMKPGDFIYAKDVVRQIDYIESDTLLTLKQGFPTDIATGISPLICEQQTYKMIYAKNTNASTAAVLQEAPFAFGNTHVSAGAPFSYDASGGGTIEFEGHK
jgi:hypothetical protein